MRRRLRTAEEQHLIHLYPDDSIALTVQEQLDASHALTALSEDETLFRDSVREFADREIRPLVREMDEHAKIPRQLIDKLFELGVMGIEVPEAYGGAAAASSTPCWRSRSCRASIRPSACSSTCRTRSSTTPCCAGATRIRSEVPARSSPATRSAPTRSPKPARAPTPSRCATRADESGDELGAQRPQALDHQRRRSRALHRLRQRRSRGGLQGHHRVPRRARTSRLRRRQEGRQARHPRLLHVRADPRRLPRPERRTCSARSARATRSPSRR